MRDALVLAGLTIGAVVALFPEARQSSPIADRHPAKAARALTQPSPVTSIPPTGMGGTTELRRAGDGHFYAAVTIGTRSVTMLVDTGASVVALTGADARAAGLVWNPGRLTVVAQGASGPVRGVPLTIERMRLGAHEAHGVRAVVIPEGLPVSLLGQSFLKDVEPMRIESDRMVLGG